jgi:glutathione-regulated potassium-efflux system protein KefB
MTWGEQTGPLLPGQQRLRRVVAAAIDGAATAPRRLCYERAMHLHDLMLGVIGLLAITALSLTFFHRLGLGSVLALLAAGVIVGPSGFGAARRISEVRRFSELGVVLLLFIIGLEMQPARLWSLRRVGVIGLLQVLLSGAAIAAYARLGNQPWNTALLVGYGFALSSTAVVLRMLQERGELASPSGQTMFGVLLMQDLAVVPLLALVPVLAGQTTDRSRGPLGRLAVVLLALAAIVGVVRYVLPRLLGWLERQGNSEAFGTVAVLAVVASAWAMEEVGASMALGTFVAGMLLSDSPHRERIEHLVLPFETVLLSLFFIAAGMSIDIGQLTGPLPLLVVHAAVLMTIKAAVLYGLCRAFGLPRGTALRVGLLLAQCGEFGFVLFTAAGEHGLMPPEGFALAALLIVLSMAATPLLARAVDRWAPE